MDFPAPPLPHPDPLPALGDRSLFPGLEARVYLNHAAISPPSVLVRRAASAVIGTFARRGVSAFGVWMAQRERLRGRLATLLGCQSADVGLVPSTSLGLGFLATCIDWRPGDRVVLLDGEFPANRTPWQVAAQTHGLAVGTLPAAAFAPGGDGLQQLEALLRGGARLVATSAVQFQTGLRMPLAQMAALAHGVGAELAVDTIQAAGVVPLDMEAQGIDYISGGAHKWLMGLEGAGYVAVRPAAMARLRPRVAGWLSHEDGIGFLFEGAGHLRYDRPIRQRADRFEVGSTNVVGFFALETALATIQALGVEEIHAHVQSYLDPLEAGLRARGFRSHRSADPAGRSGILSVHPPSGVDVLDLNARLNGAGIAVTAPDGHLRLAPHWPNALGEVPLVLEAVDAALSG